MFQRITSASGILLTIFALSACAPGSDDAPGTPAPVPVAGMPSLEGKDITNRATCAGDTPKNASVYVRGWEVTHLHDDKTEVITKLYFYAETISLFSICKKDGAETYVTVTADATVKDGLVTVTRGDSKVITETKKNATVQCEATIQHPASWTYAFEGKCLRLNDEKGSVVLTPK